MPTSRVKNILYAFALPFLSPAVPSDPVVCSAGRLLHHENALFRIIRRNRITGGAIALKNKSDYSFTFTKAIHTDRIAGVNTYYRVASITKMATALVCTVLMDRGILDRTKPVSEMIPDGLSIPELKGITIDHLLSHTSGLTDPPDLEDMLLRKTPLKKALSGRRVSDPGAEFHYSNLAFGLIGSVFESLLEIPVEQVFQTYIFRPLDLQATLEGLSLDENVIMPVHRILSRHPSPGITVTKLGRIPLGKAEPELHYGYTAGSMYITLPSLIVLTETVRDGGKPVISGAYADYMKHEAARYGKISPTLSYGHGLLRIRDRRISDSLVLGHQGFAYGCVDGAFWEESTGNLMISLNGGCSEARNGMLGCANLDMCRFAFRKEMPLWK